MMSQIGQIQYNPQVVLGRGMYGTVFSGTFQLRPVAVKRTNGEDAKGFFYVPPGPRIVTLTVNRKLQHNENDYK